MPKRVRGVTRVALFATRVVPLVVLIATLVCAAACGRAQGQGAVPPNGSEPSIRLHVDPSGSSSIEAVGLPADALAWLGRSSFSQDQWTALMRVQVASDVSIGSLPPPDRPAMLGTYRVTDGVLRFTPRFPFEPGTRYHVQVDLAPSGPADEAGEEGDAVQPDQHQGRARRPVRLKTMLAIPARERRGAATQVAEVYPTAPEVPENQLRLYISFSAPMGLLDGAPFIHLLDDRGQAVVDPFLPLDVNLWNDDRTRFTVLFDPGRQKRGIRPNEELGRSLVEGQTYTLVVDAQWPDAAGQPLAAAFRRQFRVGPPQERAIDPAQWQLSVPEPGTRGPLTVRFPAPLDYGLLQRAVGVTTDTGIRVAGSLGIEEAETRWVFTPRDAWQTGGYRLVAGATLEDVAGNRIGRAFEVSMLHVTSGPGARNATGATVNFRIGPRAQ